MEKKIKVSIIVPTFNGAKHIKNAIESILVQSFFDWELIIVDDGSNDNTENVINEYLKKDSRIIYFKNENNLGITKSLNRGLREARGEYIARIDDDDRWIDENKLGEQVEFLDLNLDHVLIGTGVKVVDEKGIFLMKYLFPEKDEEIRKNILSKNCFVHSSVMFRRESVLKLGGYDGAEYSRHIEDYNLWLKLGLVGKFHNLPIYAVEYCLRRDSISSNNKIKQFKKNLILIKKFKKEYPNYFQALFLGYLRLIFYKKFKSFLPISFQNKIFEIYKNF